MTNSDNERKQTSSELTVLMNKRLARLKDADDITLRGFVQLPRIVLYSKDLSDGDKVCQRRSKIAPFTGVKMHHWFCGGLSIGPRSIAALQLAA